MRIIIANKFYYNRGGDCIASIALEKLLKEKGHEVAFFSMKHPENFVSEWDSFFPTHVDFQKGGLKKKLQAANRIFYSQEVKKQFSKLLDIFKPDVIHLNNIHSQLSPYIGELAHKRGIKVLWTLHDYKLICPKYTCIYNNKICECCIHNNVINVLTKRCMKNSLAASLLAYLEAIFWNRKRLNNNTDYFIAPSHFIKLKMIQGGFPQNKIKVIPNFINRELTDIKSEKKDYYCYVGRLSEEKGVETLLKVAKQLPYKLIIVGTGPLKNNLKYNNDLIEFVGFKEWDELKNIIEQARFLVIPSEWYENNPISVIEAHCLGTPVLGANIGGIPEIISSANGMLFKSGDISDLKEKIQQMFKKEFDYNQISKTAREKFSAENYYNEIIRIYE
ncbi:MAG: glycosyltransferase [Parabacteroides sp.]|nr:glycosyltransferase [Parabacteroides sp.]